MRATVLFSTEKVSVLVGKEKVTFTDEKQMKKVLKEIANVTNHVTGGGLRVVEITRDEYATLFELRKAI